MTSDRFISQWQQELLINTLLIRDMPNLALQALRAPGPAIRTLLKIRTLLANDLVVEAFEMQRAKCDENLLIEFFKGCHKHKKWNHVLNLSLTEYEGDVLCKFLRTCDSLLAENLHLLYLLQRNKYIEAITHLDKIKHKPRSASMHRKLQNTQDLIISSYRLAMSSTERSLCDQFMQIKDRIPIDLQQTSDFANPLSSELNPFLADTNANVIGGLFHRAIVCAKRTGFSYAKERKLSVQKLNNNNYVPLLSSPRIDYESLEHDDFEPVIQPKPYHGQTKRRKEIVYGECKDPESNQPAAKRQRTGSLSVLEQQRLKRVIGFSTIVPKSFKFDVSAHDIGEEAEDDVMDTIEHDSRNSTGEMNETVNLLSTPVVKSSRMEKLSQSRVESRCQTPQSILKHRHNELASNFSRRSTSPSLTMHSTRRSVDFSEKAYRYTIPQPNFDNSDDFRLGAIQETVVGDEDDDKSSRDSPSYSGIKGRPPIHSANDSASTSMDEFYSPENQKYQKIGSFDHGSSPLKRKLDSEMASTSQIAEKSTDPPKTPISARRKLRSQTPEVSDPISSTRITRSKSKQSLDVTDNVNTSADDEHIFKLNTSTPINKERRSHGVETLMKPLSQKVMETNALKTYIERCKAAKAGGDINISKSSEESYADEKESKRPKNLLNDNSYVSESFMKRYKGFDYMSDGSIAVANEPQQNLLEDSSSYFNTSRENKDKSIEIEDEQSTQENKENEKADKNDDETIEIEMIDSQSNDIKVDAETQNLPTATEDTSEQQQEDEIVDMTEEIVESSSDERPNQPQNILTDFSVASESMLKKYAGKASCSMYSEASFVTSTQQEPKNLLEDSSMIQQYTVSESIEKTTPQTKLDVKSDVVNLDDDDSSSNESVLSKDTSNNTISSDDSNEFEYYEGNSDIEIDDESEDNPPNILPSKENNDVIQISSSSEDDTEPSDDENDYDDDIGIEEEDIEEEENQFGQNENEHQREIDDGSIGFAIAGDIHAENVPQKQEHQSSQNTDDVQYPVEDYNLTELNAVQPVAEPVVDNISNEQAINQMIYGDMDSNADAELNEMDINNEAVNFGTPSEYRQEFNLQNENFELSSSQSAHTITISSDPPHIETATTSISTVEVTNVCNQAFVETITYEVTEIKKVADAIEEIPVETTEQETKSQENVNIEHVEKVVDENVEKIDEAIEIDVSESAAEPTNVLETAVIQIDTKDETAIDEITVPQAEETNVLNQAFNVSEIKVDETKTDTIEEVACSMETDANMPSTSSVQEPEHTISEPFRLFLTIPLKRIRSKSESSDKKTTLRTPKSPSRRQRTVSQQNLSEIEESGDASKPRSRKNSKCDSSDTEAGVKPEKPRLRKAISSQSFSNIDENSHEEMPSTSKNSGADSKASKTRLRKATSHQSLSSIVEIDKKSEKEEEDDDENAGKFVRITRKKRSASNQSLTEASSSKLSETILEPKLTRSRRAASHQSLIETINEENPIDKPSTSRTKAKKTSGFEVSDTFQDSEKPIKNRMRRAQSHQTLTNIDEDVEEDRRSKRGQSVASTVSESISKLRSRRAASHQSLVGIDEQQKDIGIEEPKPKKKTQSESSDTVPIKQEPNEESEIIAKPRTRRVASQQSLIDAEESERPKSRSQKRLQSDASEASTSKEEPKTSPVTRSQRSTSIQSTTSVKEGKKTRSTRSSKKDDDVLSDTSSIVSTRSDKSSVKSKRSTKAPLVLPSISEDGTPVKNLPSTEDLTSSRRLTRAQQATMEKYAKNVAPKESTSTDDNKPTQRAKRQRKGGNEDEVAAEDEFEQSDSESIASTTSKTSKTSTTSKKSKVSTASSRKRTLRKS